MQDRKKYIDIGKVTCPDVAQIYSDMTGLRIGLGDPEFLVLDDLENPSSSADFPSLRLAREAFPDAILSDRLREWLNDQPVTHHLTVDIKVPAGESLNNGHLFSALEMIVDEASRNPDRLMSKLVASGDVAPPEVVANWVIRQELSPGVALSRNKEWITLDGEDPAEEFLYEKDAGYGIALAHDAVWCRSDLVYGEIVPAVIRSDDRGVEGTVDIRPFLEVATQDDIEELIADDWSFSEASDRIAYDLENAGDPGAGRLFWYLGFNPGGTGNNQVGFSVEADGEKALEWIEENRPEIFATLSIESLSPPM